MLIVEKENRLFQFCLKRIQCSLQIKKNRVTKQLGYVLVCCKNVMDVSDMICFNNTILLAVSGGTLLKSKSKSAEQSKSAYANSQQWDNKSQISSILKNG